MCRPGASVGRSVDLPALPCCPRRRFPLPAGKLFPGPHLYAGAAITVLWALAASLVPAMQARDVAPACLPALAGAAASLRCM